MDYRANTENAIELLKNLIKIPSVSGEESGVASQVEKYLAARGIETSRKYNNVWAVNKYFDPGKKTLLLNSHLDTVMPVASWTKDPFTPREHKGRLFGLGSNDAGASLVTLLACFVHYFEKKDLAINLEIAATAEEEISGEKGISSILEEMVQPQFAIVGEPTNMEVAIAEKGLIVLECRASGISGHAARDTGENAIINALPDIAWFNTYDFPRRSDLLGALKMSVTKVHAGSQHNVIPDTCDFTVDIRTTDIYEYEEILDTIKSNISAEIVRCSDRLKPSAVTSDHVLVRAARCCDFVTFVSPTISDQAFLSVPSVKIGPGNSLRSHTADEFVYLQEIDTGIDTYINYVARINTIIQTGK